MAAVARRRRGAAVAHARREPRVVWADGQPSTWSGGDSGARAAPVARRWTEAEWTAIKARLAAFVAWNLSKPDLAISALDAARIKELAKGDARTQMADLIAADAALEAESNQIDAVEKAIRLRRDLVPLLRNFISFADFYGKRDGTFQTGTLYIDGRSCNLVLSVHDVAKHALLASLAKAYLLYCDCTRKGEEKRVIVAAMTAGDVDNLMVGRNGIFYDKKGRDW